MRTLKIEYAENLESAKDIAEKYISTLYEMSLVEFARNLEKTETQNKKFLEKESD